MSKVNTEIQVQDIPFFNSVLPYAINHGNKFVSPAHLMLAVMNDYGVRKLLIKAFDIDTKAILEISRGLVEYCEHMKYRDAHGDGMYKFTLSMEMYDFIDTYKRCFEKTKNMTCTPMFLALYKSSYEVSSIFETVIGKPMDAIVKKLANVEGDAPTFGMTVDEYMDFSSEVNKMSPDEIRGLCGEILSNSVSDDASANLVAGLKKFYIPLDFSFSLKHPIAAEGFYESLQSVIGMNKPILLTVMNTDIKMCLGYDEIYNLLDTTKHLDKLDDMLNEVSKLYDLTFDIKEEELQILEDTVEVEPSVEEPKKEVKEAYMYGNENLIDIAKDMFVRLDNPYLIVLGDSGTGKTTFVEKIISMAEKDEFSDIGLSLYPCSLDIQSMFTGSMYKGAFESSFNKYVANMVKKAESMKKKPLLILEDINNTVPGQTSGDVTAPYKLIINAMNKYHFPILGTCTYNEYRVSIAKNRRYADKFTTVRIQEPDKAGVMEIMAHEGEILEKGYNLKISESVYERVYDLSNQFMRDKRYPGKALLLLNQASAYAYTHKREELTTDCVEAIMSRDYNVPSARLNTNLLESIDSISNEVKSHVFGQDEAVDKLVKYWKIKQAGLTKENKPIASLLFVGPTGVGKTELAKQFANSIGYKLLRFDMSEYTEGHTISKLIGSPAGYVAHEEGGLLVNAIKETPNCVLLLDELEKAHPNIYNVLLQIMDNAELTGNSGEKADFQNVVLIMTSNCGARDAENARSLGFARSSENEVKAEVMQEELNKQFTPEFRGRLSGIVQFNPLSSDMCVQITDLRLRELEKLINKTRSNISLECSDELKSHIVNLALSKKAGGRSIEKYIDENIKDRIVNILLENNTTKKSMIRMTLENESVDIKLVETE